MRRVVLAVLAVMAVTVVSACQPPPPPLPADYQLPVIESLHVSPQPAGPGDVVTLVAEVSDDEQIIGVWLSDVTTPDGVVLNRGSHRMCTHEVDQGTDVSRATVTITCSVPNPAVSGTWKVAVWVEDFKWYGQVHEPGLHTTLPFEVVGTA